MFWDVEYNVNYVEYIDCLRPLANKVDNIAIAGVTPKMTLPVGRSGPPASCKPITTSGISIGSAIVKGSRS